MEIARHGISKPPFYITGHSGSRSFSVHSEGEKLVLLTAGGARQEIDLRAPVPSEVGGIPSEVIADVEKQYEAWRSSPSSEDGEKEAIPEPLCPTGHPTSDADLGNEEPLPPGVSAIDGLDERLAAAGEEESDEPSAETGAGSEGGAA